MTRLLQSVIIETCCSKPADHVNAVETQVKLVVALFCGIYSSANTNSRQAYLIGITLLPPDSIYLT